ncbi:hypothetical protein OZX58_03005 [Lactobacillus sp. ESL0680]|uniref:hypothetical protein n=1 Tax=Lactobacillus sp. ESL0680 TaxID=2983210 RepID=UPI0023F65D2B|nr:hypothetical protein [Lactobacillus sp. ESL0680]WEV39222.1 hypothetical protein OZX58_03005 [Lactobacillus sp. ESL0680]
MKREKLIVLAGFLAIAIGVGITNTDVSAHSFAWWSRPRKVEVVKPVQISEIKKGVPLYKSHCVGHKVLKKGTQLKIQHAASYIWIVQKKGLANGYFKTDGHKYFWVAGNYPKYWYKLVK